MGFSLGGLVDGIKKGVEVIKDAVVDPVVTVGKGAVEVATDIGGSFVDAGKHVIKGEFGSALGDLAETPGKVFGTMTETAGELIKDYSEAQGHIPVVGGLFEGAGKQVGSLVEGAGGLIKEINGDVTETFGNLLNEPIKDFVVDPALIAVETYYDSAEKAVGGVIDAGQALFEGKPGEAFMELATIPGSVFGEQVEGIGHLVENYGEMVGHQMPGVAGEFAETWFGTVGGGVSDFGEGIGNVFGAMPEEIGGGFDNAMGAFGGTAEPQQASELNTGLTNGWL